MKTKTGQIILILLSISCLPLFVTGCTFGPAPPGQAESGYGSSENYITNEYTYNSVGNEYDGTRAWYFVPDALKNGSVAPVVIFLHGHTAVDYHLYMGHIMHLIKQGYLVIYPEYQLSGPSDPYDDLDQTVMLDRAIASVQNALNEFGPIADAGNIVLYGHSLGGLLAFCWAAEGGPQAARVVLANANLDPSTGIPKFVLERYTFTFLDYENKGSATTSPVIILWGDADTTIAPYEQQLEAYNLLTNAASRVIYTAQTDKHGWPTLQATHGAALQPSLSDGDEIDEDALDFRFYYAALDAALDGQDNLTFDMGTWSDETPVKPVLQSHP